MLPIADDGRLQMTAGLALLETSNLVVWDCDANEEELDLAEQGMTDYADGLADEDVK